MPATTAPWFPGIGTGAAYCTCGSPARMYATRSATCVFEITGPQTGMKGRFGFFDSPRPCVMIRVSVATVSDFPIPLSAGT